jgi:uncharacterized protein (TIGR03790 family)
VRNSTLISLLLLLHAGVAWAGGSGLNTVVVVNQNSANSVQLGNDYCEKRGVPPQNLFRMTTWKGSSISWLESEFEGNLRDPLLAMLQSSGLTNQIQYIVLSMDVPYRVLLADAANSTTSDLFYGFHDNGPGPYPAGIPTCALPDLSSNSFAFSELPFDQAHPNTAPTNSFLAFMLTDDSLAAAESVLDRAVAADSSFPTQAVLLEKTSDSARNVRFFGFDNAIFDSRVQGASSFSWINSDSTSFSNIRGLLTGLATLSLPTNSFVPGALGDSLTSYAGALFENTGQTTLLAFLNSGSAASYGTVVEPCNYVQKFPDPLVFFYQTRGFSAAEAYYLSLLNPYQGVLVGEPLCAPFAAVGQASWDGLSNGTALTGTTAIPAASFSSASTNLPLTQVDLFIDGTFARTVTNIPPTAGNMVGMTLNASAVSYEVPVGASIASVVSDIADAVNSQSNVLQVVAAAVGDRLELQGLNPNLEGSNMVLAAETLVGSAPLLTTFVSASRPGFLDSIATGYGVLTVTNVSMQGDWLQLQITQTNGTQITVGVTNNTADTNISDLCRALLNAVNATPALQGSDGVLGGDLYPDTHLAQFLIYTRSPGWPAAAIQVTLTASSDLGVVPPATKLLEDNLSDLRPRNHLYVTSGVTEFPLALLVDSTQLADGFHELTLVGYEGTSVRTQTRVSRTVRVQNTGLSATISQPIGATNVGLGPPLIINVAANTNNISTVELFGSGGSFGVVSNQATTTFTVSTTLLGLGLHPFYAVVTDTFGEQFRSQTIWLRVVPSLQLSITGPPLVLSWTAVPANSYDVLASTNLLGGFQKIGTVTATGTTAQWPVSSGTAQAFYRVRQSGG